MIHRVDPAERLIRAVRRRRVSAVRALIRDGVNVNGRDEAGKEVGSGVYFYRLKTGSFEKSHRMTVLR